MRTTKIREYMTSFICIGSDCIDDCCSGWNIPIFSDDRQRLENVLSGKACSTLIKEEPFPQIRKRGRSCMQQCEKGLCSVQKSHGHHVLPNVCASYPRALGIHQEGEEIGGFLSCPEIARSLTDAAPGLLSCQDRPRVVTDLDISNPQSEYEGEFLRVREYFVHALIDSDSLLAFFHHVAPLISLSPAFFHQRSGDFESLQKRLQRGVWKQPLEDTDADALESAWEKQLVLFLQKDWPYPKPISLLKMALEKKAGSIPKDIWLRAYVRHDWDTRWYVHSPDLVHYWQCTLFKLLMVIRIYRTIAKSSADNEAFVLAVYSTERLVEHTSLKRDLHQIYNLPWTFSRWVSAFVKTMNLV